MQSKKLIEAAVQGPGAWFFDTEGHGYLNDTHATFRAGDDPIGEFVRGWATRGSTAISRDELAADPVATIDRLIQLYGLAVVMTNSRPDGAFVAYGLAPNLHLSVKQRDVLFKSLDNPPRREDAVYWSSSVKSQNFEAKSVGEVIFGVKVNVDKRAPKYWSPDSPDQLAAMKDMGLPVDQTVDLTRPKYGEPVADPSAPPRPAPKKRETQLRFMKGGGSNAHPKAKIRYV